MAASSRQSTRVLLASDNMHCVLPSAAGRAFVKDLLSTCSNPDEVFELRYPDAPKRQRRNQRWEGSLLQRAVWEINLPLVDLLLARGADPNFYHAEYKGSCCSPQLRPLEICTYFCPNIEVANLLIRAGAYLNHPSANPQKPADSVLQLLGSRCVKPEFFPFVELLVSSGARVDLKGPHGVSLMTRLKRFVRSSSVREKKLVVKKCARFRSRLKQIVHDRKLDFIACLVFGVQVTHFHAAQDELCIATPLASEISQCSLSEISQCLPLEISRCSPCELSQCSPPEVSQCSPSSPLLVDIAANSTCCASGERPVIRDLSHRLPCPTSSCSSTHTPSLSTNSPPERYVSSHPSHRAVSEASPSPTSSAASSSHSSRDVSSSYASPDVSSTHITRHVSSSRSSTTESVPSPRNARGVSKLPQASVASSAGGEPPHASASSTGGEPQTDIDTARPSAHSTESLDCDANEPKHNREPPDDRKSLFVAETGLAMSRSPSSSRRHLPQDVVSVVLSFVLPTRSERRRMECIQRIHDQRARHVRNLERLAASSKRRL